MDAPPIPHNSNIPAVTQKVIEGADVDFISFLRELVRLRLARLTSNYVELVRMTRQFWVFKAPINMNFSVD